MLKSWGKQIDRSLLGASPVPEEWLFNPDMTGPLRQLIREEAQLKSESARESFYYPIEGGSWAHYLVDGRGVDINVLVRVYYDWLNDKIVYRFGDDIDQSYLADNRLNDVPKVAEWKKERDERYEAARREGTATMWDHDGDGRQEEWDTNDDDLPDVWDVNNDGRPDVWDRNCDGIVDTWDRNFDGRGDMWDTNNDGKPDLWDKDYDGKPDAWDHSFDRGDQDLWDTSDDGLVKDPELLKQKEERASLLSRINTIFRDNPYAKKNAVSTLKIILKNYPAAKAIATGIDLSQDLDAEKIVSLALKSLFNKHPYSMAISIAIDLLLELAKT